MKGADPVVEFDNEVVGGLVGAKLQVDHSVHPQLSYGHHTSRAKMLTKLGRGDEGISFWKKLILIKNILNGYFPHVMSHVITIKPMYGYMLPNLSPSPNLNCIQSTECLQ